MGCNVWWADPNKKGSDNKPIDHKTWEHFRMLCQKQLSGKKVYVMDGYCGANENSRMKVRFVSEVAWQAHFVKNMFIRPSDEEVADFEPDFVVLNAGKTTNPDWKEMNLNSEVFVAGCEGDVPAMLSMMIVRSLLGISGFQANPSTIDPETGEMLFAHCTIPLDMVERYDYDTHFESGIGVGIRGYMKEGPVTIFKLAGDLSRYFVAEGALVRNQAKPDLCRTQQVIALADKRQTSYFLTHPIGNHHIIMPGHQRTPIEGLMNSLGIEESTIK